MKKITSFTIDHLNHPAGIYLSRQDGDVYTYDVRICKPYTDEILSNSALHSLEHLLATILRNDEEQTVYVGPMGCQTGFYVLFRDVELIEASEKIKKAFRKIAVYDGEMPGGSKVECGYCFNLSVQSAKETAVLFLQRLGEKI
ncbi:MAG: S-ribosylhomocysteine lyase [Clostridia bacterium]|nr:S-ribosylhomocysteine lyase [Clostridia bacterium]